MKSSLRIAVVFVLITVLIFPAQMMSSSAQEPTNSEISDKLDQMQQTILELSAKVDNLESSNAELINTALSSNGEVSASAHTSGGGGEEKFRISIGQVEGRTLESVGLFGDCGGLGTDFTKVNKEHCVFSVESIRVNQTNIALKKTFIKTICVDEVSLRAKDMRNCVNTFTNSIVDLGIGIGPTVEAGTKVGGSAIAEVLFGANAGLGLGIDVAIPIKSHSPIPLRDEEFLPIGGMILHDTGIGTILAEKFVTVGLIFNGGAVDFRAQNYTFIGTKPVNMDLYIGKAGNGKTTCQNILGVVKDCDDLKAIGSTFGNILRVACLRDETGVQGSCSGGGLTDDELKASTLVSASEQGTVTIQQASAIFDPPCDETSGECSFAIDIDLTDDDLKAVASLVSSESGDLLMTAEKILLEVVSIGDVLDMFFTMKNEEGGIDEKIAAEADKLLMKVDLEEKLASLESLGGEIPNVSKALTDLGTFIDSFAIAPGGFTAVELAKRFGTITEDIDNITGSADDVKDDINRVIADINKFKNSDIDIDINPPKVNTESVPSAIKNVVNALCAGGCGWNGKISIDPGRFSQNIKEPFKDIFPDIPPIE